MVGIEELNLPTASANISLLLLQLQQQDASHLPLLSLQENDGTRNGGDPCAAASKSNLVELLRALRKKTGFLAKASLRSRKMVQ